MRRIKVNKFLILIVFFAIGVLSMGASSWLIINEQSGSPSFMSGSGTTKLIETTIVMTGTTTAIYEDDESYLPNNFQAIDADENVVEGTFAFELLEQRNSIYGKQNSDTSVLFSNLVVKFYPTQNTIYAESKYTIPQLTIYPVAYDDSGYYYGNIAYALEYTTSKSVYVKPGLNKTPGGTTTTFTNLYNPRIYSKTNVVEIKSNYKLILPYDSNLIFNRQGTKYAPELVTKIKLDCKLVINGELIIGGVLGSPGQGISNPSIPAGVTSGKFTILEMGNNSTIETNGTINCYGYITDPTNTAKIQANSGTIYMPFVVHDYPGGSITAGSYQEGSISPFNIFDCPNIHAELICKAGANITTYASLHTGEKDLKIFVLPASWNLTTIKILGKSGSLINLKNGFAVFKYTPTQASSFGNSSNNSKPNVSAKTSIKLNGDTVSGALSMKVMVLSEVDVSLTDVKFPVSFKYDIELCGNNDYTFSSMFKFLPGSSLTINKDAKAFVNQGASLLFYDDFKDSSGTDQSANLRVINSCYPADMRNKPAVCTVNGELVINGSIGGLIDTQTVGAKLDVSNSGLIVEETEGNGDWETTSGTFTGVYTESQTLNGATYSIIDKTSSQNVALGNDIFYCYNYNDNYYWIVDDSSFNLEYDHGKLTQVNSNNSTTYKLSDVGVVLEDPTTSEVGYEFAGWFLTEDYSIENQITTYSGGDLFALSNGTATIYAKWVSSSCVVEFNNENTDITLHSLDVAVNTQFNPYIVNQINELVTQFDNDMAYEQYFGGWYLDESFTNRLDEKTAIIIDSDIVIYAKWIPKTYVSFITEVGEVASMYLKKGESFNPYQIENFSDKNEDINHQKYFEYWSLNGNQIDVSSNINIEEDGINIEIVAKWGTKITIKFSLSEDPNIDLSSPVSAKITKAGNYYFISGNIIAFKVSDPHGAITSDSVSVKTNKDDFNINVVDGVADCYYTVTSTDTITVNGVKDPNCVAAGTLITLADGTQKKVEDLVESDILLVFDHESGQYVSAPILFIERDGWAEYNVINLEFSNGTTTKLIYEHALFDLTLNKYVYITESNYGEFVGHEFAVANSKNNAFESVTLTRAYVATEYTGCYSLVTAYHLNYFIDGMLSIPGGITGLFNYFEYGEGLKYDEEQMQADIEKYGLYTYEDFKEYVSYEVFEYAFAAKYFKVSVGKGLMTYEDILALIERYVVGHDLNKDEVTT